MPAAMHQIMSPMQSIKPRSHIIPSHQSLSNVRKLSQVAPYFFQRLGHHCHHLRHLGANFLGFCIINGVMFAIPILEPYHRSTAAPSLRLLHGAAQTLRLGHP